MERGQRRSPQQPYRGQPQRPAQRPQQRRPVQSGRPSRPGPYKRRRRRSRKPIILGAVVLLAILLIVIISVSVHNAREDARLTAQIKANAATVTPFSDQIEEAKKAMDQNVQNGFPLVAYDANGVRITLTDYKRDAIVGDELNYLFENNSSVPVMFGVGNAYVDGWQITTLGGNTLPAGTKTNGTIYISKVNLEESGISRVTNLMLKECSIWNDETFDLIENFDITLNLG